MKVKYGNWELSYKKGDSIRIVNELAGVIVHLCEFDAMLFVRGLDDSIREEIHYRE